jgi:hypothetical protein
MHKRQVASKKRNGRPVGWPLFIAVRAGQPGGARALEPNGRLTETAIEIAPPDRQPAAA